ncbi:hypothetical protein [Rhizobium sp. BK251]|uniref:hypothetical protein n=1 Tax=Rhizobium sp. BK251 TaxID=2512125 RepID=UPI00104515A2|nr:hypothetical protein [Rhizobium sp. BK251]
MTDSDLAVSALDQPMSLGSTFWDQAKGGVVESFGLGTGIRNFSTPEAAPPEADGWLSETLQSINRAIDPSVLLRRALGTSYDGSATITEDQYKRSPSYRADVPWSEGMTDERAASLAEQDDIRKVRDFYAQKRPITAFFGNLGGQAIDPINYIPIFGEVVQAANVARFGRIAGRAVTAAGDAAANTALAGLTTAPVREQLGDDVSWQSTVSQIAMAALIGGAFGAVHGRFGRASPAELRADAEAKLATLDNVQSSRVALNDALDGMIREGEVNLSRASSGYADNLSREVGRLSEAYDSVRTNPTGPTRDPLVSITPDDIDGMIVSRGAFRDVNEVEFSKRGWGLVKVIWGHGDKSKEPPEFQVSKEDIVDLPNVVRDYEPSSVSEDGLRREWRIERNGRTVVYADTMMGDNGRHLVTTYIDKPKAGKEARALSERRPPVSPGSRPQAGDLVGDTAGDRSIGTPEAGRDVPAEGNIAPSAVLDNNVDKPVAANGMPAAVTEPVQQIGATQRPAAPIDTRVPQTPVDPAVNDAAKRVGKPEGSKALAEQYRVNPETGEFPEMADIDQLRAEGRLTEEDIAALDEADETIKTANAYGEALKSFASCVI